MDGHEHLVGDSRDAVPTPADQAAAARHLLLERIDAATLDFQLGLWRAAADAGFDVRFEASGELAMVASRELRSSAFNRALGHRTLPHLTDRMRAFFERSGTAGWIVAERPPWPGALGDYPTVVFAAEPAGSDTAALPDGLATTVSIREIAGDEADSWSSALVEASAIAGREGEAWIAATRRLVGADGHHHFLVEEAGRPIAVAGLFTRGHVGLLATAAVLPSARGRGLQRVLIEARVRVALEHGCTVVTASALAGGVSAANLATCGFHPVQEVALYRVDPSALPAATMPR